VRVNGDGALVFTVADKAEFYIRANAANGEILEVNPSAHRVMFELSARIAKQGGAALLIDYGHVVTRFGDTLQALRAHRYIDPLVAPGECDLTAHVDFAAMARSASAAGAAVYGPIDQGDFLRGIGIDLRTKALAERATLDHAEEFERARARLVGKGQGEMGALFKTLAVADRRLRPPPGFQAASAKPA
jgi:NADH dehydrogenase [ubiquinone] 1 alpha subcomplex assembly factor 7